MNTRASTSNIGLINSWAFDGLLIVGTLSLALLAWGAVHLDSELFYPILVLDLWLLGYHHVIATYTRIASDMQTLREHRFMVFVLPWLVLGAVLVLAGTIGMIAIASIYLYWQWWHYLRQSEGVSKTYLGRAGMSAAGADPFLRIAFYGLPLASFLTMVDRQPGVFLGMRIFTFPVPDLLLQALWALSIGAALTFIWRWRSAWRAGKFLFAYPAFLVSHIAIFIIGYAGTTSLDHGWLAINIWHNTQYLLFVYLFNQRRYKDGVQRRGWLLSFLSQPGRWWLYFLVLFTATTVFYFTIDQFVDLIQSPYGVPMTILVYQAINFHHYIVDSFIWKLRRKPIQEKLGIGGSEGG